MVAPLRMRWAASRNAPEKEPANIRVMLMGSPLPVASAMAAVLMVGIASLVLLYTRFFGTEDLA